MSLWSALRSRLPAGPERRRSRGARRTPGDAPLAADVLEPRAMLAGVLAPPAPVAPGPVAPPVRPSIPKPPPIPPGLAPAVAVGVGSGVVIGLVGGYVLNEYTSYPDVIEGWVPDGQPPGSPGASDFGPLGPDVNPAAPGGDWTPPAETEPGGTVPEIGDPETTPEGEPAPENPAPGDDRAPTGDPGPDTDPSPDPGGETDGSYFDKPFIDLEPNQEWVDYLDTLEPGILDGAFASGGDTDTGEDPAAPANDSGGTVPDVVAGEDGDEKEDGGDGELDPADDQGDGVRFGKDENQKSHTVRHIIEETSVNPDDVLDAIRDDLRPDLDQLPGGLTPDRTVTVDGVDFDYNVFKLPDGTFNVGRITPSR